MDGDEETAEGIGVGGVDINIVEADFVVSGAGCFAFLGEIAAVFAEADVGLGNGERGVGRFECRIFDEIE